MGCLSLFLLSLQRKTFPRHFTDTKRINPCESSFSGTQFALTSRRDPTLAQDKSTPAPPRSGLGLSSHFLPAPSARLSGSGAMTAPGGALGRFPLQARHRERSGAGSVRHRGLKNNGEEPSPALLAAGQASTLRCCSASQNFFFKNKN